VTGILDATRDDLATWPQLRQQLASDDDGYVLPYLPPCLIDDDSGSRTGWWDLQTVACFNAGDPPPAGEWSLEGPQDVPAATLTAWAGRVLGRPVTLEPGSYKFKLPGRLRLWHAMPLYWVTPC